MPVIKRYPNRKLYDTEKKQYITLEGIAELIRHGEEIHVVDHASGEDLTALTLTQVITEQEKKGSGFLPRTLLASLIQAGGERFSALQRSLFSSTGFWQETNEEIKRRVQALINLGELSEQEGGSLLEKLISPNLRPGEESSLRQGLAELSGRDLENYLAQRELPTRADLQRLDEQLETLSKKLDEMNTGG